MISITFRGLDRFRKAIRTLESRAIPHAIRDTLNGCAFALRTEWQKTVRSDLTNRNKYTERSIRVDRARGINVRAMVSRTGSVAAYMGDLEEGTTARGKGKHKVIPAPAAAGHAPGAGKRTRVVRQALRISGLQVAKQSLGRYGKRRQNAITLAIAQRKGERFVLLNRQKGSGRGLFEVRAGGRKQLGLRMLYDLSRGSVRVPARHTLKHAIAKATPLFEREGYRAFLRQLKRARIFT